MHELELKRVGDVPKTRLGDLFETDERDAAFTSHFTFFRQVIDSEDKSPLYQAVIQIQGINHNITTTKRGEFWRLLAKGNYR